MWNIVNSSVPKRNKKLDRPRVAKLKKTERQADRQTDGKTEA